MTASPWGSEDLILQRTHEVFHPAADRFDKQLHDELVRQIADYPMWNACRWLEYGGRMSQQPALMSDLRKPDGSLWFDGNYWLGMGLVHLVHKNPGSYPVFLWASFVSDTPEVQERIDALLRKGDIRYHSWEMSLDPYTTHTAKEPDVLIAMLLAGVTRWTVNHFGEAPA